jgi:NAD(P)-dependent dehydrogenase (short-subunit alcohol dehydrogenase family)
MSLAPLAENLFGLAGRVAVVTGGAGLLGVKHCEIIAAAGGIPVMIDIDQSRIDAHVGEISRKFGGEAWGVKADITRTEEVQGVLEKIIQRHRRIDILINNAAIDAKVGQDVSTGFARIENFPLDKWDLEIDVGLKGAFICCQIFGGEMAKLSGGVILNIGSEYGVNGPDQRLYRVDGLEEEAQPVKPITYTVVKSGLIGMSRYFALYWGPKNVRVNTVSFAGVRAGQSEEFVQRYTKQVPLGRMAEPDEYQGTVLYLCADASKFLTGVNLTIDGGKHCW